ncbi:MAG: DUF481 domain-containing protein [Longimicrobiales bacterium]
MNVTQVSTYLRGLSAVAVFGLVLALPVQGQDEEQGWANSTELSFVQTGGNATSATFGLANTLTRSWAATDLKFEVGGIRTSTTTVDRSAVGLPENFQLTETSDSELSAENYYMRLRLDRTVSARTTVFVQSGWVRNTFSGFDSRIVSVVGVANQWVDTDERKFSTSYGGTLTAQDDIVPNPLAPDNFLGGQLSADFWQQFNENTEFSSNLVLDQNFKLSEDFRGVWVNSLGVSMSENLALKTTFQILFDNDPSLVNVPLMSSIGDPLGDVGVPLNEFDRVLTVALVVSF